MHRLNHRRKRLSVLFGSLHRPRSSRLRVGAEVIQLPLRLPFRDPSSQLHEPEYRDCLRRLADAFDLFGWITPYTSAVGIGMSVITRLTRADIPLQFCKTFGGCVFLDTGATERTLPRVSWRLNGEHAVRISRLLLEFANESRKREVLEIGARWPSTIDECKKDALRIQSIRRHLKNNFFASGKVETWSDFAKIFDGRGHVTVSQGRNIRIAVCHQNIDLLQSISTFVEKEVGEATGLKGVHTKRINSYWYCQRRDYIKSILTILLSQNIVFQKSRAEAALRFILEIERVSSKDQAVFQQDTLLNVLPDETNSMKYRRASPLECIILQVLRRIKSKVGRIKRDFPPEMAKLRKVQRDMQKYRQRKQLEAVLEEMRDDIRLLLDQIRLS